MRRTLAGVFVVSLVCTILFVSTKELTAGGVESVFAGRIFILNKRPPSYFRTKGAFVSYLKRNSLKTVHENRDKTWTFQTMAFFKRPLGDYEVEMVFYDIKAGKSKRARRFVNSYTQYTQDRNTRSLSGKTTLIRPPFDANRKYMVVAQSHGRELAKGEFTTRGTTQAALDNQKRMEKVQKEMEESIKDLERKAKEQAEREKKESQKAADDLF